LGDAITACDTYGLTLICNERDVVMNLNKIQILQLVKKERKRKRKPDELKMNSNLRQRLSV
jgi:hypothetical protein